MNLILASASPRRREILSHLGVTFTVLTADTDESSDERNGERLVELLARRKAQAVAARLTAQNADTTDTLIIAADTVVVSPSGEILGKPQDADDAERMLRALSGNAHHVVSGIAVLVGGRMLSAHEVTEVRFSTLTDDIIARYVASGEPMDKAGAYGIQDTASLWIDGICGDYFNVVGLPVRRLERLLNEELSLSLFR